MLGEMFGFLILCSCLLFGLFSCFGFHAWLRSGAAPKRPGNEFGHREEESATEREDDPEASAAERDLDDSEAQGTSEYGVFLSFRGPDCRQGLADVLYSDMTAAGIHVFRDNNELEMGDKITNILPAIENSKICVPIFSETFAASPWCLREVEAMVEQGKTIMPIFHTASPEDVKLRTELFKKDLRKHEKKHGSEQVKKWEDALKAVGKIIGREVKTTGFAEFSQLLVRALLIKLKVKKKYLSDFLVKRDYPEEAVMKLLDIDSSDIRFVGIHGMGGIGKTTLAKVLFDALSTKFDCCSFLENVRESLRCNGVEFLQKQLLEDLDPKLKVFPMIDSTTVLQNRFRQRKVLIILDDANESKQLEMITGVLNWFGSGSRIIVTTRDKRVFTKETRAFELHEMNEDEALQLFSRHAFGADSPPSDYQILSNEVILLTGRLPLALEVIGSLLQGCEKKRWKSTMDKLRKVPNRSVQEKLKISFDALEYEEKQIFLDISCFFINKEMSNPSYLWEACELFPYEGGIEALVSMSLLKIKENKFGMHDLIRDLGRALVREECAGEPAQRSRIWSQQEALEVLKIKQGKEKVEGLIQEQHSGGGNLTNEQFSSFGKLRLLKLVGAKLAGDFEQLLPKLKWFSWHGCPSDFRVANLSLDNLVVLDLSWSSIDENWAGWSIIQMAKDLKVLDLTGCCNLTTTPDLSNNTALERLILKGCSRLAGIHSSIGKQTRLKHLDLEGCSSLRGLPEEFGMLEVLKVISVEGNGNSFHLPESIGQMRSLSVLKLQRVEIVRIPDSIGALGNLVRLSMRNCTGLKELPDSLGDLKSLVDLDLSHTQLRTLPNSVGRLSKLQSLDLARTKLDELPDAIGDLQSLVRLDLSKTKMRVLPDSVVQLVNLESLVIGQSEIEESATEREDDPEASSAERDLDDSEAQGTSEYGVFLSFRGPDCWQDLADVLCNDMRAAGIRVFRDDDELEMGDKITNILPAIENSKICVPIFSKNFAASPWCLREVEAMVEQGKTIMPIFHTASPDDVMLRTGLFKKDLRKHGKKHGSEQVKKWEDALKAVGKIIGRKVNTTGFAEFSKLIVRELLLKLKVRRKYVTDSLVKRDEQEKALMELLDISTNDVRLVGIYGMGGVGKTTLVKVLFNAVLAKFECCSFLENVQESLRRTGLESLQRQLLGDLDPKLKDFLMIDSTVLLQQRFRQRKVLIVLDDINRREQIEMITGMLSWFGSGSRIIITTRDKRVLTEEKWGFEVSEMNEDEALQLFSRHAFDEDSPPSDYQIMSNEVIRLTGQLPLALEVIGSLLRGCEKNEWKANIRKLNEIPNQDVHKKLKISFDALEDEQKQIFLDIACFFLGEETSSAIYLWDACKFHPEVGIKVLVSMSLVKITEGNTFWMHDLIRDLGRELIRKESSSDPAEWSRVWSSKEAMEVLKIKRLKNLRSLEIYTDDGAEVYNVGGDEAYTDDIDEEMNQNMDAGGTSGTRPSGVSTGEQAEHEAEPNPAAREERDVKKISLEEEEKPSLTLAQVKKYPGPSESGSARVMSHDADGKGSEPAGLIQPFPQAKLLESSEKSCEFLMRGGLGLVEPPEVSEWERAKEICLMYNDLTELPESPRCLSLSALFLQRNGKLRTIPSSFFSHMPALEVLNLSRTCIKSLPDSLFQLVSLKRLFLNECVLLRTLPAKIGELKNLEVLDLGGTELKGLPTEIEQLVKLTCLEFSILGSTRCESSKEWVHLIPPGVLSSLPHIEELNIEVSLDAKWWDSCAEALVNEICSLERLNTLKFYFPKVELMKHFGSSSLTHFRIVAGKHIGRIMSRLPLDVEFELERWDKYLKYVHGEGVPEEVTNVLKQADAFFLDRHADVKKFSDFGKGNLEQLKCCVLGECNELQVLIDGKDFQGVDSITLSSLEYLYVYYMKSLETIWSGPVPKGSLSCLKSLTLRTCPKVTSIVTCELLGNLCLLEELTVEKCSALVSLVSCNHSSHSEASHCLPVLRKMSLHYLPGLTSISSGRQVAPKVEWLSFYNCPNVKSLDLPLQGVKRIRGDRIWWEGLEWSGGCPGKLDDVFVAISKTEVL